MPGGVATGIPTLVMVFVLGLAAGAESQQAPAPAPAAGGCTALLAQVADCLQYVTPGSPLIRPPEKCCAEVNAGLKDAAAVACVCGLLGGRNFNLPLNLTRTAGLPVACGAPATSLSQCNATSPPPAAPSDGGTGGSSTKSAATRSPIMAGLLIASLLISGYRF